LLISSYNNQLLRIDNEIKQRLNNMINVLAKPLLPKNIKNIELEEFYICNIVTGECTCWEYIWNGSLRDKCRHCHAAILFEETQHGENIEIIEEIRKELVQYFRNKERVIPASMKNNTIYQGTIEDSFTEIIRLYNTQGKQLNTFLKKIKQNYYILICSLLSGKKIFCPSKHSFQGVKDPFRPIELKAKTRLSTSSKIFAKPRKSREISLPNQSQSSDTFSEQQRKTKRI